MNRYQSYQKKVKPGYDKRSKTEPKKCRIRNLPVDLPKRFDVFFDVLLGLIENLCSLLLFFPYFPELKIKLLTGFVRF